MRITGSVNDASVRGILDALTIIGKQVKTKVTRRAVTLATQPLARAAKAKVSHVPDSKWIPTDNLKKSIGRKTKTYPSGVVVGVVGPRKGFKITVGSNKDGTPIFYDPAFIAHLVEMGHGGPHPAPAHPFLRPAYMESVPVMKSIMQTALREGLEAEAIKAASKFGAA